MLFYWMLMLIITVTATPRALLGPRTHETAHWNTERTAIERNRSS